MLRESLNIHGYGNIKSNAVKIIIGSDHAGYALKKAVVQFLKDNHVEVEDIGTDSEEPVDYPDYGYRAAERVSDGSYEKGILICGSGIGMSIVANKVPGIRAALCMTPEQAEFSRSHNDANILVLAGRFTDEQTAKESVRRWLNTEFEGGRHARRVEKIHSYKCE